jgi:hypothetical protein
MLKGFAAGFLLALLACATMKNDQTVCAEYRGLRCMSTTSCSMDQSRGCKVCRCDPVSGTGADGNPTVLNPPADQR